MKNDVPSISDIYSPDKTIAQIADECLKSYDAVRNWLHRNGLEFKRATTSKRKGSKKTRKIPCIRCKKIFASENVKSNRMCASCRTMKGDRYKSWM